jgi:ribosomal protein S18 acetylase RimI-like enzyme
VGVESEGVVLRRPSREDDEVCAKLLVQVPGSFLEIAGDERAAVRMAAAAFGASGSAFGRDLSTVAILDGRVIGIVVAATAEEWRRRRVRTGLAMLAAGGVRPGWRLIRRGPLEERLLPPIAADALYVAAMAVDRNHRRKGIGALLMDHAVREARDRDLAAVGLDVRRDNTDAIRLYERQGFVIVTEHHRPPGRGLPAATSLRMEWKLTSP